ncbi:8159_t:CDS:10, partial [Ambispora leptoticha]
DINLRNFLRQKCGDTSITQKLKILHDIADGLAGIHNNGFVHRNLHPGNVVADIDTWQIADVGLIGPCDRQPGSQIIGVLPYLAPEVLLYGQYSEQADIYSLAMIIYEMMMGQMPFWDQAHDAKLAEEICKGLRPEIHKSVPQKMAEFLRLCWHEDPKKRPTAEKCKELFAGWTIHKIMYDFKLNNGETYSQKHPQAVYTSRHFHFENLVGINKNNPNLRVNNKQSLSGNLGNGNVIEHSLQLSFSGDSPIDVLAFETVTDLEAYAPDINTINEEDVKKSEDCNKETTTDTTFQSYDLGKCPGCTTKYKEERWCRLCTQKNLEIEFKQWTSENPLIDECIRNAQLSATSANQLIEWIPYEKFSKIIKIGHGCAGEVYSVQYLEGFKVGWNANGNTWDKLIEPDGKFALKTIPNSVYITEDWLKEVISGITSNIPEMINYYGITRNPDNGNLMVVMKYAQDGNLRDYLRKNFEEMTWEDKFDMLQRIANDIAEEQWKTSRNPSVVSLPGRLNSSGPMTPTENSTFILSHSVNLSLSLPSVHTKARPYAQYQHTAAIYESRKLYFPDVMEEKEKFEYSTAQLEGKRLSIRPNFPDSETTKYSRNTDSPDILSINSLEFDVGATKIDPTESLTMRHHMRRISNVKMGELEPMSPMVDINIDSPIMEKNELFGTQVKDAERTEYSLYEEKENNEKIGEIQQPKKSKNKDKKKKNQKENDEGFGTFWGSTRHRSNSDSIDSQALPSHDQILAFFSNSIKIQQSDVESTNEDQIKESDFKKRPKLRRYSSLSTLSGEELDTKRKRDMERGPFTSNLAETMEEDEVLQERRRQLFGNCGTCNNPNTDFDFCHDCRMLDDILLFYESVSDDEDEKEKAINLF